MRYPIFASVKLIGGGGHVPPQAPLGDATAVNSCK